MQKKPSIVMFKTGIDLVTIENPSVEEILSNVCGSWKVDKKRILNIKYAAAVMKNKIVAVFEVSKWVADEVPILEGGNRYRFIGKQASPNIAHLFVGKDVSEYYNGSQNPVKYLDDEYELKINAPGRWEVSIQKFASPQERQKFVDSNDRDSLYFSTSHPLWYQNNVFPNINEDDDCEVCLCHGEVEESVKINLIATSLQFKDKDAPAKVIAAAWSNNKYIIYSLPKTVNTKNIEKNSFYSFSFPQLLGNPYAALSSEEEDEYGYFYDLDDGWPLFGSDYEMYYVPDKEMRRLIQELHKENSSVFREDWEELLEDFFSDKEHNSLSCCCFDEGTESYPYPVGYYDPDNCDDPFHKLLEPYKLEITDMNCPFESDFRVFYCEDGEPESIEVFSPSESEDIVSCHY